MKKAIFPFLFLLPGAVALAAGPAFTPPPRISYPGSTAVSQAFADSVNRSFHYQTGCLTLPGALGKLTVPAGFHYLDSTQSSYVLHQLWHNPRRRTLGMLFPTDAAPLAAKNWGYTIEFDAIGHVEDADADAINYDRLLEGMRQEAEANNSERAAAGYAPIHVCGWGARPSCDPRQHTLHWAKLLGFGSGLGQTLNYNVRILGRRGVLVLNAIAEPRYLPEVKASVPGLLAGVQFVPGEQYADFRPELDEVAAYSVGGLVAGKVLTQTGAFVLLAKFWKAGLLAFGAIWTALRRFLSLADKRTA